MPSPETSTVIEFPRRGPASADEATSDPVTWDIDDWGRDATLAGLAARLLGARWHVAIGGEHRLPDDSAALVVINSRRLMLSPWFAALTIGARIDRPVRFVGRPDAAPAGALARRLGGLLARPDEVAGALRDGQVLVFGATGSLDPRRVGEIDHRIIGAAVQTSTPTYPATVSVSPLGRSSRIEIGDAVRAPRRRRGPLAELELAERLHRSLVGQLESSGPPRTGTPLDWIPISISGGQ